MPDMLRASVYDFLKLAHVSAIVLWIGAIVTLEYLYTMAVSKNDAQGVRRVIAFNEWLTKRLYVPASLSTIIFGLLATWQGPWQFTQFWVLLGIVAFLIMFVMGVAFFSPEAERILKIYAEGGDDAPAARERVKKYMLMERLDMAVMYVAMVDMIFKPSAGDVRFWVVAGVGAVVIVGLALRGNKPS